MIIKDSSNQWTLYFVDDTRNISPVEIDRIKGLQEALDKLPATKKAEDLDFSERQFIENLLRKPVEPGIKFAKNRSSSQNMFSCLYTSGYGIYFHHSIGPLFGDQQQRVAHQVALKRELPLPVFQKIIDTVVKTLELSPLDKLESNSIVPSDSNDNHLQLHLRIEARWIRALKILEDNQLLTDENRHLLSLALSRPDLLASVLSNLVREGCFTPTVRELLTDHLEGVKKSCNNPSLTEKEKIKLDNFFESNITSLGQAFLYLGRENLLTDEMAQLMMSNLSNAATLGQAFAVLKQSGQFRTALAFSLAEKPDDAFEISQLHPLLKFKIINETNVQLLKEYAPNSDKLASVLSHLASAGILSEDNKQLFIQHLPYLLQIADDLSALHQANALTDTLFKTLLEIDPRSTKTICQIVTILAKAGLSTTETLGFLIKNEAHLLQIEKTLQQMQEANQLTPDSFTLLMQMDVSQIHHAFNAIKTQQQSKEKIKHLKELISKHLATSISQNEKIVSSLSRLENAFKNASLTEMLDWRGGLQPSLRETLIHLHSEESLALTLFFQEIKELDSSQPSYTPTPRLPPNTLGLLEKAFLLTDENRQLLQLAGEALGNSIVPALLMLSKENLLTDNNQALFSQYIKYVVELKKKDQLTKEEKLFLSTQPQASKNFSTALIFLAKHKLLTDSNKQLLVQHPTHALELAKGFIHLRERGSYNEANCQLIAHNWQYSQQIAQGLAGLPPQLLTEDIKLLFNKYAENAEKLSRALRNLAQAGILTETKERLVQQTPSFIKIAMEIDHLQAEKILTQENLELLLELDDKQLVKGACQALIEMNKAGLLTEENRQLLRKNVVNAQQLCNALKIERFNDSDFKILVYGNNSSQAEEVGKTLIRMRKLNLLTNEALQFLTQNGEFAFLIQRAIQKMQEADLLSSKTFALFMQVELTVPNVINIEQIIKSKLESSEILHQLTEIIYRTLEKFSSHTTRFFSDRSTNDDIETALSRLAKATPNISSSAMLDWKEDENPSLREIINKLYSDQRTVLQTLQQEVAKIDQSSAVAGTP